MLFKIRSVDCKLQVSVQPLGAVYACCSQCGKYMRVLLTLEAYTKHVPVIPAGKCI